MIVRFKKNTDGIDVAEWSGHRIEIVPVFFGRAHIVQVDGRPMHRSYPSMLSAAHAVEQTAQNIVMHLAKAGTVAAYQRTI